MKNKIRLFIGWFGVLTPVYAAGALTVVLAAGEIESMVVTRILVVSAINCVIGYKLLKVKIAEKGAK